MPLERLPARDAILNSPSTILASALDGYDYASRLQSVNDGNNNSATYSLLRIRRW